MTAEEHERWFAGLATRTDTLFFAVELTGGQHVGNVWLADIDRRHHKAELRIVIGDPEAMGRGVGTEAIRQLCAHGFEHLDLHKVYAYVLETNPRARRSFEKAGFVLEGVLKGDRWAAGRFVDVFRLARLG